MDYKGKKGGRNQRKDDDPLVKLSKILSYLLRHGASQEGVEMRTDGFVKVSDIQKWKKLKGISIEQIKQVVEENNKKRFELQSIEVEGISYLYIRAVQGHTIEDIDDELLLEKITDPTKYQRVIHGTFYDSWKLIKDSGLKTMGRNHVHFAIGLPGEKAVISGMRLTCEIKKIQFFNLIGQVFIEIDMEKAISDGMTFYISKNGVILTSGFEKMVPAKYFKKVVDIKGNDLLTDKG